jgi:hypothetical protein
MRSVMSALVLAMLSIAGIARGADTSGILYFSRDSTGTGLYVLNQTTGAATLSGSGISGVTSSTVGLTESNDADILFGSKYAGLLLINADGSGASGLGSTGYEALAFDPTTGTLYGGINGNLTTVNQSTGGVLATLAAPGTDVEGLTYGGNGKLYGLAGNGGSPRGRLLAYDIASNTWSTVGDSSILFDLPGLAWDPFQNVLYAKGSQDTNLYRIDPATAATTVVGNTGIAQGGGLAFVAFPSLGGTVFDDANKNGSRDAGEPGLDGVTVDLDADADATVDATAVTGADGSYTFGSVRPGTTYRVRLGLAAGHGQTSAEPADVTVRNGIITSGVDFGLPPPLAGDGDDSDGDGFSDDVEAAAGTDPHDSAATPFGGSPVVAGAIQPLPTTKVLIKLNFAKPARDAIVLNGALVVRDGFVPAGAKVILDAGGVTRAFVLDAKGAARVNSDTLRLGIKQKGGVVQAQTAKLKVKLAKGAFATALADEGLTGDTDQKKAARTVVLSLLLDGKVFQKSQSLTYSAKHGKSGAAKQAR